MAKTNEFQVPTDVNETSDWYHEIYLTGAHWRWRKESYIKWAGFYCQGLVGRMGERCRNLGTQIHHLNYNNLYCERNDDLLLLCRRCHQRMHRWPKAANDNGQMTFLFDALDQKKVNND